jgi:hypothetical protein
MMEVSGCYGGAPVVMSAPHFYNGHEELVDAIEGMNPNKDLHDTIMMIEPTTGIVLSANKRIQVGPHNMFLVKP